ncbi:MAG TPA: hypothetical protein PLI09_12575 [Candidatus Hydrogenedentes bacterium]|nr:hypothetical protein [Candidatus Hydrogenedentota bacterium]
MLLVIILAATLGLIPQAMADNPVGMALTRQLPGTYTPGGPVEVQLTLSCSNDEGAIMALGLYETVPAGWTFVSMRGVSGVKPQLGPTAGESGILEFAWFTIPVFPYTFAYTLNVPANAQGQQTFTGQIEYRLSGGALLSDSVVSTMEAGILVADAEALRDGFLQADQDANGALSFEEASAFLAGLLQEQFDQLDADGDGAVTLAELNAYIEANTSGGGCNCGKAAAFSKDWFTRSLGDMFLAGASLLILAAVSTLGRREE